MKDKLDTLKKTYKVEIQGYNQDNWGHQAHGHCNTMIWTRFLTLLLQDHQESVMPALHLMRTLCQSCETIISFM